MTGMNPSLILPAVTDASTGISAEEASPRAMARSWALRRVAPMPMRSRLSSDPPSARPVSV